MFCKECEHINFEINELKRRFSHLEENAVMKLPNDEPEENTVKRCSPILPKYCSWYKNLTTTESCHAFGKSSDYRHCHLDSHYRSRPSCICCEFKHIAHYKFYSVTEALGYPSADCAEFAARHRDNVNRCNGNGVYLSGRCHCYYSYSGSDCTNGCRGVARTSTCFIPKFGGKTAASCHDKNKNREKFSIYNSIKNNVVCRWFDETKKCTCCLLYKGGTFTFPDFARIVWVNKKRPEASVHYDCPNEVPTCRQP